MRRGEGECAETGRTGDSDSRNSVYGAQPVHLTCAGLQWLLRFNLPRAGAMGWLDLRQAGQAGQAGQLNRVPTCLPFLGYCEHSSRQLWRATIGRKRAFTVGSREEHPAPYVIGSLFLQRLFVRHALLSYCPAALLSIAACHGHE